jgi:hypothetical protein
MKAEVKLNPVRLSIPKYGNGLMLAMEYLAKCETILPTGIYEVGETIELKLPYTKHSIKSIQNYINANL